MGLINYIGLPIFCECRAYYEKFIPAFTKEELDAAEKASNGYIGTTANGVKCFLLPFFQEQEKSKDLKIKI